VSKDDETPFSDQVKKVVDELDLEGKVKAAAAAAEDVMFRGLGVAGQFVHERRDGIESFLDRAVSGIDEQTGGRYAEQVGSLRDQLSASVASLADRRWTPVPDDPGELSPSDAAPSEIPPAEIPPAEDPPGDDPWAGAADDPSGPPRE
jgi:hypothetical protein